MVTPSLRRLCLETDEPVPFAYTPGQHIRIELRDPRSVYGLLHPSDTLRTYTIWDLGPDRRRLEIRTHLHEGPGIGKTWAAEARPGDPVAFWWPEGDFFVRPAAFHLFVGEESASAAFGPMLRSLEPGAAVYGVLESESPEHDVLLPGPHELRRVHRRGTPAASSPTLLHAVTALELPDPVLGDAADAGAGPPRPAGSAYLAGEARTCQMVRDHLVRERGWPRAAIKVKPFWTPGRRGMH
jgi:NADPH-dependent ferric siderophore reductase